MRLFMIAIVILSVGAGASFAQTDTGSFPSGAAPASPPTGPASLTNSAYSTTSTAWRHPDRDLASEAATRPPAVRAGRA